MKDIIISKSIVKNSSVGLYSSKNSKTDTKGKISDTPQSMTRSEYFNPLEKKWVKIDPSEESQALRKLVKMCEKSDYKHGKIFDIKLNKQVKLTLKNKEMYKEHINFCRIYNREIVYRNKLDTEILLNIMNSEIEVQKGQKIKIKDIGKIKDADIQHLVKQNGIPAGITALTILITRLITTDPELGEKVRRKAIDIVNHSDNAFSTIFFKIFNKKGNVNILKRLFLATNPVQLLSIFITAITAFISLISPLIKNLGIERVVEDVRSKYFDSKVTLKILIERGAVDYIKNDIQIMKNPRIEIQYDSASKCHYLISNLHHLGFLEIDKNISSDILNNKGVIIRFKKIETWNVRGKEFRFNTYSISSPRFDLEFYINKTAKQTIVYSLKNDISPKYIKEVDLIREYVAKIKNIEQLENKINTTIVPALKKKYIKDISNETKYFDEKSRALLTSNDTLQFLDYISETRFKEKLVDLKNTINESNVNSMLNNFFKINPYGRVSKIITDISYVILEVKNKNKITSSIQGRKNAEILTDIAYFLNPSKGPQITNQRQRILQTMGGRENKDIERILLDEFKNPSSYTYTDPRDKLLQ